MKNAKKCKFGQKLHRLLSEKLKKLKNFIFFICAKPNVKNEVVWIFEQMLSFF